jgi:1,4-alpha-glucan branching enzyme
MAEKPPRKASPKRKKVLFSIRAPEARTVSLAGNFNEWDVGSLPMKKDSKGVWRVTLYLTPGSYEYRFVIDGVWHDDPKARERVDNPFGTQNSVKIVR